MPRISSPSKPKSAFCQVVPKPQLTQRTPVAPYVPAAPVPQTVRVEHKSGGIWDSMKQGFGWGIGTSIARNIFGPDPTVSPIVPPAPSSVVPVQTTTSQELVGQPAYTQCRKEGGDHEACKQYIS